jgi:hypothetical protein
MVERFLVGQRVRLKRRLATQPWGLLPRGTTGTVTNVGRVGEIDGEIAVWVRMDQHVPSLDPWNNVLLVKSSEITAETGLLARLRAALRRA